MQLLPRLLSGFQMRDKDSEYKAQAPHSLLNIQPSRCLKPPSPLLRVDIMADINQKAPHHNPELPPLNAKAQIYRAHGKYEFANGHTIRSTDKGIVIGGG